MECVNKYFIADDELVVETEKFPEYNNSNGMKLYEVVRVIEGIPLFIDEHIKRFHSSAKKSGNELFVSDDDIMKAIKKLIKENECYMGNVKIVFCLSEIKHFLCYFVEHKYPDQEMYLNGVKTLTYKATRPNPEVKAINEDLRDQVSKLLEENPDVYEILLLNSDKEITEGSKSNVLFVKGNRIITAPMRTILKGITRDKIFEICEELGFVTEERMVNREEVHEFEACFLTGTSPKVLPISYINDIKFDHKNKIMLKIKEKFEELVDKYILDAKQNDL
ncbi:MAG: aminotransferase class IV [Oscillospiraceae bacterium]|nr:aminotransferase class IV [Oscillospiraceae bacterium]